MGEQPTLGALLLATVLGVVARRLDADVLPGLEPKYRSPSGPSLLPDTCNSV